MSENTLLDKISEIFKHLPKGKALDLGCGRGEYSSNLKAMGFDVVASDFNEDNLKSKDIPFVKSNILEKLPFPDSSFDYLIFLETIEHLEKPFEAIQELSRVLRKDGTLILSTPNILNVRSRLRFLFEGCFDFFREPPIDLQEKCIASIENIHIIPWRYHELEYMLFRKGFDVTGIYTDKIDRGLTPLYFILCPVMTLQRILKERKSLRKGGMDFRRINKILRSKEMLFGKHLIMKAVNNKNYGQSFGYFERKEIKKFGFLQYSKSDKR